MIHLQERKINDFISIAEFKDYKEAAEKLIICINNNLIEREVRLMVVTGKHLEHDIFKHI